MTREASQGVWHRADASPCAPLSYGCAGGFRFQLRGRFPTVKRRITPRWITPRCCFEKPSQTKQNKTNHEAQRNDCY